VAEAEIIAGIKRGSTVQQEISRRGVPRFDRRLQKVADGLRTVLAEVKLVIEIIDQHNCG